MAIAFAFIMIIILLICALFGVKSASRLIPKMSHDAKLELKLWAILVAAILLGVGFIVGQMITAFNINSL